MQWDTNDVDRVVLQVTRQEVRMLNNALSESLDRVPERVFPTLMGAAQTEVAGMLADFRRLRSELHG